MTAAAAVKMFFLREARQAAQAIVPPHWYREFDIGSTIRLTHFAAVGDETQVEPEDHQTANLVALYRIDEATGQVLTDTSGQANDGELGSTSGADADDPAWIAEGLAFDGVDDIATAPFLVDPDASDFTAWAIFRASAAGARRVILFQQDGAGTGRVWLEIAADNFIATHIGGNVNAHSIELEAGRWYAATLRKLGTTISLFLEGGDKEDFTETAEAADGDMLIGWDEVEGTSGVEVPTPDLSVYLPFDDGAGDTALDHSGNSNDGQLGSAAGSDSNDPDWVLSGLSFVRANPDTVIVPNIFNPNTQGSFTVFVVFKATNNAVQRTLCSMASTNQTWLFLTTGHLFSSFFGGTTKSHTSALSDGTWYVCCARVSGSTALSLFIDGGSKQDFTIAGLTSQTGSLYIGSNPGLDTGFDSEMAFFAVYDAALSDGDVGTVSSILATLLDERLNEIGPPTFFDDRIGLIAVYDDAMSDTAVAANTVSLKRILNEKVSARGFYRVLGSGLISVGPSLAVQLRAADLTQEQLIDLFVPPVPESLALIDGSSLVTAALSGTFVLAAAPAGVSLVTADLSQRVVASGLQHLWLFNEGSGTTLEDLVGSSDGTLAGEGGAAGNRPSWVTEGLSFDGTDDWVTWPNFQSPGGSNWTFMLVFKSPSTERHIFGIKGSLNNADWLIWPVSSVIQSWIYGIQDKRTVAVSLSSNTWYMVSVRRATSSLTFNTRRTGMNQQSVQTGTPQNVIDGFHVLGVTSIGDFPITDLAFDGQAALMAHWSRSLSDAEMTTMFDYAKAYLAARGISL
jgi:hypothetical protein